MTRIPGLDYLARNRLKNNGFSWMGGFGWHAFVCLAGRRYPWPRLDRIFGPTWNEPRNRVPRAGRAELWTAVIDAGDFDSRTRRHRRRFNTLAFHVQRPRRATPPAAANDFFFFYVIAVVRAIYPYGRHDGLARARHRHTGTWRVVPGCPAAGTVGRRGNYPAVAVNFSTGEGGEISYSFYYRFS